MAAIFPSDLIALIFVLIAAFGLYGLNKLVLYIAKATNRLSNEAINKLNFALKVGSMGIILYLIIAGFPILEAIPAEYSAIITGAVSTGLAFVSSEIFANLVSGLLLFVVDPFDLGHVVKIKGHKGIIREITLTKVVIETFDNIMIEFSNTEIVSSKITNYTVFIDKVDNFGEFRKLVETPQDKGSARVDVDIGFERESRYQRLKEVYNEAKEHDYELVHAYTFRMNFPFEYFRIKIDKAAKICIKYKEIFGFRPRFHIVDVGLDVDVKFRILTFNSKSLLNKQPDFAHKLYEIILEEEDY
ncbi:MAG: mechanosensitive ion channel [Promethearchaeota archaeon]|nr:MAG: mechanosensitive ion channel [Candidatus Lokiarchaeota archaeon]